MSMEDIYYDEINSSELYKDIFDVESLNKNKIEVLSQMNGECRCVNVAARTNGYGLNQK